MRKLSVIVLHVQLSVCRRTSATNRYASIKLPGLAFEIAWARGGR